ncbi:MAG: FtsX-like permease family protein, partial [Bacteroidota bacterium]
LMQLANTFLKTYFRTLKKSPLFTFINIMGLSIGLAASLLIYIWVYDEVSYDKFHENSERIYRVERDMFIDGRQLQVPITSVPVAPGMMQDYPQVIDFTRIAVEEVMIEDQRMMQNTERIFYADTSIFSMFSFDVLMGDAENCLKEPYTIALSETAAEKYLGDTPSPGSVINININQQQHPFRVTAIYQDMPSNSHLQSDFIASFITLNSLRHETMMTSWMASFLYSYVLLEKGTDADKLEVGLQDLVDKYFAEEFSRVSNIDDPKEIMTIKIKPLTSIHLSGNRTWEIDNPGSKTSVMVFSFAALLLLVIAGINFMNLSTARATRRAREVGIRKVSGATKEQLVVQFLAEALLFSFTALLLALLIVETALPQFNALSGKEMSITVLLAGWNLPLILLAWMITSLLAAVYPAFFLSAYQPVEVLKGQPGARGGQFFRKLLVTGQFIISVGLIISSITAYRQLQYISNKDLGYNREGLINIPIEDRRTFENYDAFRNELLAIPHIESITRSMIVPTTSNYTDNPFRIRDREEIFFAVINYADAQYIPTFEIDLLAGENFQNKMVRDSLDYFIINEAASGMFGFANPDDAIGKQIGRLEDMEGNVYNWGRIVGVCNDFHFQSLTENIQPMIIFATNEGHNHISLRVNKEFTDQTHEQIKQVWHQFYPDKLYGGFFISENFDLQHMTEHRLQTILLIFTVLSVFVACLGLWGLSAFSVEKRIKEIGIRKTLGAQSFQIIHLIASEFSKLIIIAGLISLPFAWMVMNDWLNNFPYRRELELWVFALGILLAWIIAMITIWINAWKSTRINPVDTLQ